MMAAVHIVCGLLKSMEQISKWRYHSQTMRWEDVLHWIALIFHVFLNQVGVLDNPRLKKRVKRSREPPAVINQGEPQRSRFSEKCG